MSDQTCTTLPGGHRVAKDGARIEAYGAVDELNAFVGTARALAEEITDRNGRIWPLVPFLLRVQHELFNLARGPGRCGSCSARHRLCPRRPPRTGNRTH
jgi:cob(I)alamin adenosyltransferase